jgi:hypothetical protein
MRDGGGLRDWTQPAEPVRAFIAVSMPGVQNLIRKPGRLELRRHSLSFLLLLTFVVTASPVSAKKRVRDLFGLKIGMSEESVHKKLKKIATQQKEEKEKEEAEQEVWSLRKDDRFDYILTRFNRDHRLTLITVVARPSRVRYSDVAETKEATVASDGRNYSYRWKVERDGRQPAYLLIARGSSSEFLTSYSLYPAK